MARQLGAGDQFGDYRIEDVAGRGGMGIVFRARQRRPDRTVAIKVIAPELAADRDFRARFEQESAMAAQIEHPNVIPVYEVGDEDGLLYIAMRYVDGVDLGGLLKSGGPLAPTRAAHLLFEVAGALDAAHAHGLVHRDVKPGNILVATGDHVYLTDFGLSKQISDTQGLTATGMFVGTLDYIAPEQIEGRRVDARTDIYALGCVLYELLAGVVPFPRDSEVAKLYAHVHDYPAPLVGVPAPLGEAIARAMSKRPADRFQSAGDFGRAVVAGAAGRTDHGTGRVVAAGDAAISDAQALTEVGSLASSDTGGLASTKTDARSPLDLGASAARPGAGRGITRGPRRRWVAGGAAALVAAVGAVVAIALGSGGPTPTTTTTTTTTTTPPPPPSNRAILAPATTPPSVDECQQQLMFAVDGTAGPVKCSNGDVNAVAWKYYARDGHRLILSLGSFATPPQALAAMCKDGSSTIPLEQEAYQLAKTYYQWQFAVDPSTEYPSSC